MPFTTRARSAAAVLVAVLALPDLAAAVERWHPIKLSFQDNETYSETGNPNPFVDRRLVATLTAPRTGCSVAADCAMNAHACVAGSCVYKVEGYFDSDLQGGPRGSSFSVIFSPHLLGRWRADARFCEGQNIAANVASPGCGQFIDDTEGLAGCDSGSCSRTFDVVESSAKAPDFRAPLKGVIVNDHRANGGAGESYLRFLGGDPGYFVEVGMNAGEGMLGYVGFDNTKTLCDPNRACVRTKTFEDHVKHWKAGDPDWTCGVTASSPGQSQTGCTSKTPANAGRGIIGAINYLSDPANGGVNAKYLMLNSSPNGDTCDVYPFLDGNVSADDRSRYDVSKLDQWRIVFEHMMSRGVLANLVLGEDENECTFQDNACSCSGPRGSCIGNLRRVYIREMVARFGHLPALRWSVDEENDFTNPARRDIVEHLKALDPYDPPVSIHTGASADDSDEVYVDSASGVALHHDEGQRQPWDDALDVAGYQATFRQYTYDLFAELWGGMSVARGARPGYRAQSVDDRMRWPVIIDEPQGCDHEVLNDGGTRSMPQCRKGRFFPGLFSGLAGWEWYFEQTTDGNGDNHDYDPCVEDFAASAGVVDSLRWSGVARQVFEENVRDVAALEWWDDERFVSDGDSSYVWQGARPGQEYIAYQNDNDALRIDLRGQPTGERFNVVFVDPDLGDSCECDGRDCANDGTIAGGAIRNLGACPCCDDDSLVIVQSLGEGGGSPTTTLGETSTTTVTTTSLGESTTTTLAPAPSDGVDVDETAMRWTCQGNASDTLTIQDVTVGPGNDRILVVGVGAEENDADCDLGAAGTSVSYRGEPLERAVSAISSTSGWRVCNALFYLLSPPVGSGDVVVSFPSDTASLVNNRQAGALVAYGAAQRAPEAAQSTATTNATNPISLSLPATTAGALVVDVVSQGRPGQFSPTSAAQIERWDVSCTSSASAGSTQIASGSGTTKSSWSHGSANRMTLSVASFAAAPTTTSTTTTTLPPSNVNVDAASARWACGGGPSDRFVIPGVTVGTEPDQILVVAVGAEEDDGDCNLAKASATYDGQPLELAVAALSDTSSWRACNGIFYLLDPPSGSGNVVVTFSSDTGGAIDNRHGGALVIFGAAQEAPELVRAAGSAVATNPVATAIDVAAPGSLGVDIFSQGNVGSFDVLGANQSERWESSCTSSGSAVSTMSVASPGSATFSWTHDDPRRFAHSIVSFRPAD